MKTIWLTFFCDTMADYRELWGSHFVRPGAKSVGIVRDALDVTRSLWDMREWWGLTTNTDYMHFLEAPYSEQYRPSLATIKVNLDGKPEPLTGHDPAFAQIDVTPLEHHYRHSRTFNPTVLVEYPQLVGNPQDVMNEIADAFHLPKKQVALPLGKVGYNV